MKYEFFIIGEKRDIIFGFAANLKHIVYWMYDLNNGVMEIYKSMVGPDFQSKLEEHISENIDLIDTGHYELSTERQQEAIDWLLRKELIKDTYGVK